MLNHYFKKRYSPTLIWTLIVVSLAVHFLSLLAQRTIFEGQRWVNIPLHAGMEMSGALIAVMVGVLLLSLEQLEEGTSFNVWIAGAMVGMGILDGFHGVLGPGNLFVWLHSTATLIGGLLFLCMWVPNRPSPVIAQWWVPGVCIGSSLFGIGSMIFSDAIPLMVENKDFTLLAQSLNVIGGGCLFVSALRLVITFIKTKHVDDLLFCLHCLLFGAAAIMFEQSVLWDSAWWGWHILRLMAFGVALWFIVLTFQRAQDQAQSHLREANMSLEERVNIRTAELTESYEAMHHMTQRQQAILGSAGEGIYGIDLDGKTTFVNPTAARLLQYEADDLLGLPMHATVHHSRPDGSPFPQEHCRIYATLREGKSHYVDDEVLWRKDGLSLPVEYTCSPIHDEKGAIQGGVLLFKDISERLVLECEKKVLRDQLLCAVHEAGKSEIATGILHNVGNVLNSTNIAAAAVSEKVDQLEVESLIGVVDLFAQHAGDLQDFLTTDPSGRQVPELLEELASQFSQDQKILQQDIEQLHKNLNHIRSIIAAQQKYAKNRALVESVNLSDLIEDALEMAITSYGRIPIEIRRSFGTKIILETDRHKVMQIVINLFHNARHALLESHGDNPCLDVAVEEGEHAIRVDISDNGIGIDQASLPRIFEYGFTTKADGNGYGLHTASLAAQELGGSFKARSAGLGQGATFSLTIPKVRLDEPCDDKR